MERTELIRQIQDWKDRRGAVILAHSYQIPEVQEIADVVGDSLELSLKAMEVTQEVIVFAGVRFMAETAAILAPEKTVLLPAAEAGCPLADMATAEQVVQARQRHPDALFMAYVNTSAEVKAECDICCTSANALELLERAGDREVVYLPDQNLARYAELRHRRSIRRWDGFCLVHHLLMTREQIQELKEKHPAARVMAHPECSPEILELADHVLGTGGMLHLARTSDHGEYIVATEIGMVERLAREVPHKVFHPVPTAICENMKKTTLETILQSLERMQHRIVVPEPTRSRARKALIRMIEKRV